MKELYVDIGNSFIKVARYEGVHWKLVYHEKIGHDKDFYSWIKEQEEYKFIVCSVILRISKALQKIISPERLQLLQIREIPKEKLNYKTPKTLGMDRFLTCYGAAGQTSKPVVVIDAGSACTIDFMTEDSIYIGGVIMPGLDTIIQAASQNLPALPAADYQLPDTWPGMSTLDSLRWGTTGAFFAAIQSYLEKFEDRFGPFDLFVTGGATDVISRLAEAGGYEIKVRPHLIFEGMARLQKTKVKRQK